MGCGSGSMGACGLQIWFVVGGHWFCEGSRRLLRLGSRAWRVAWRRPMGVGCMKEVQGGWCVWPEIVVARLMAVPWVVAAMAEIGRKGRVGWVWAAAMARGWLSAAAMVRGWLSAAPLVVGGCYGGLVEACRSRVKGSWGVSFSSWVSNVCQSD